MKPLFSPIDSDRNISNSHRICHQLIWLVIN